MKQFVYRGRLEELRMMRDPQVGLCGSSEWDQDPSGSSLGPVHVSAHAKGCQPLWI